MKKIILICMLFMFVVGTGFLISIAMKEQPEFPENKFRYEVIHIPETELTMARLVMYDRETGETYKHSIGDEPTFYSAGNHKWYKFVELSESDKKD